MNFKQIFLLLVIVVAMFGMSEARPHMRVPKAVRKVAPKKSTRATPLVHAFEKRVEAARAKTEMRKRVDRKVKKQASRKLAEVEAPANRRAIKPKALQRMTMQRQTHADAVSNRVSSIAKNNRKNAKVVRAAPSRNAKRSARKARASRAGALRKPLRPAARR
mmetsp:Transcript_15329/g.30523  ORF Transcript_15329/g.30523 Transcript_15329/m.30523 type:complete len:162 (+) Transcript_15329:7-492(+)